MTKETLKFEKMIEELLNLDTTIGLEKMLKKPLNLRKFLYKTP